MFTDNTCSLYEKIIEHETLFSSATAEAYSEPCQISKMKRFPKIFNGF